MEASAVQLKEIDITLIELSGANPRKNIKGENFDELKASIDEHGILEPLVVRPKGADKYELVAGERRYTAAKALKLEMVPVAVRELDDATARMVMLLENLQREDLEPLEEAAALEEILKTGLTQDELAKKVSKSQPWVANRLRLLKAPKELKKYLKDGDVTPQHIVALLPFVEREELKAALLDNVEGCIHDAKNGYDSFTVDDAKRVGQSLIREEGFALDLRYYNSELAKVFDYTGCDTCKSLITLSSEEEGGHSKGKEKDRYCLNEECFEARLAAASEKYQAAEAARQGRQTKTKAAVSPKKKLQYGEYKEIRGSEIDTAGCKGCPNCCVDTTGEMTYSSNKGARLCVNPSCYRGKISARSRVRNKEVRATIVRVEEATKEHLQGRTSGLTEEELRFIHRWVSSKSEYKAKPAATGSLKTPKELEDSILACLVKDELAPIRYNHSESGIETLQKHVPFKVPKAPKAQAKKTAKAKKGASS